MKKSTVLAVGTASLSLVSGLSAVQGAYCATTGPQSTMKVWKQDSAGVYHLHCFKVVECFDTYGNSLGMFKYQTYLCAPDPQLVCQTYPDGTNWQSLKLCV